ncbi:MAG TPA: Na+/H+ antiporter [Xanthomonadales bacterium]|nr:Na+/H+ antiporter [Xanthomonadales bacterium]
MSPTALFELVILMFGAIIALHWAAAKVGLPPSAGLLVGGAALAFVPGLPTIAIDPELVLVIFLPPLLLDGAWSIALGPLRRHLVGVTSLAVGAVVFTCGVVALVTHLLVPELPWAACAALGAIVSPPDAVSARALLERIRIPRRLRILLEGESLLNDATGLVLFRFVIAAGVTGLFSATGAVGAFLLLAIGGLLVGFVVGKAWVLLIRRLDNEYLIIAATALLSWTAYLLGELLHVSGVIATVTTGIIASRHQHTVLTATVRLRGESFWAVMVFLMEAAVFILIGLSLRGVLERAGGLGVVAAGMGWQILAILAAITATRFAWIFGSDVVARVLRAARPGRHEPLGARAATVLSWAGVRGVVTLALALSVPEGFPGRDFILAASFAVIFATLLLHGTTLGRVIRWANLVERDDAKPRMTMAQAEASMARAQLAVVAKLAHDGDGKVIHPRLLESYTHRARAVDNYAAETERLMPVLHAHFDVVLAAVAAGRQELIRLHRAGDIDDETMDELERDLDLEELSAIAAKS